MKSLLKDEIIVEIVSMDEETGLADTYYWMLSDDKDFGVEIHQARECRTRQGAIANFKRVAKANGWKNYMIKE